MRKVLNFIGTGTAFSKENINTSAFYKTKDKIIFFDCGENIFHEVIKQNILNEKIKSIDVIITSFLSESVGSLGSLVLYCHQQNINEVNIIYPNKEMPYSLLNLYGINTNLFTIKTPTEINDYYLKEYRQTDKNVVKIPSYGYHFINDNDNFYYSGVNSIIDDKIIKMFKDKKIYYLYQDLPIDEEQIEKLKNIIEPLYRKRIMFMHLYDSFDIERIKSLGFNTAR